MLFDCILWQGKLSGGYGRKMENGVRQKAHRLEYAKHNGLSVEEISGKIIRHICNNPACVNPEHLKIGTHADNMRDKVESGRESHVNGESHGNCKLTDLQIAAIRNEYIPGRSNSNMISLALKYGVNKSHILRLIRGKSRLTTEKQKEWNETKRSKK